MIYKKFRKNLFIYFILQIMIVSVMFYTILFSKANNSPIDLITLRGNKKLIEDIKIQGLLGDSKANYIFNINGDKKDIKPFSKKLNLHYFANYYKRVRYLNHSVAFIDENFYEMSFNDIEITNVGAMPYSYVLISRKDKSLSKNIESKLIKIQMAPRALAYALDNNNLKVMEHLDDKLYFVLPSNEEFSGTSGIYQIDSFDKGNVKIVTDRITDKDTVVFSKDGYRKLADINLQEGKIQVKGLYGEGDHLYIVLIENNNLVVRLFNRKEEKFTDKVIVYEDNVSEITDNEVQYNFKLEYGRLYENKLSIVMAFEDTTKIVTVEYKNKLSKISDIDINYDFILDHRNDDYTKPYDLREGRIYDVIFKNDLLYIIDGQKLYITHYINGINKVIDYNLNLSAYNKASELKYSGKIESGVNDDNISESTMSVALKDKFVKTAERRVYYEVKFR